MVEVIPNTENTVTVKLEPLAAEEAAASSAYASTAPTVVVVEAGNSEVPTYSEYQTSQLKSATPTIPKVAYSIGKKVLSLDVETTGLNPWEYKLIVCSVWDLEEPKADMKTFAGWDEEALCIEMFDYIASKEPDVILAFNAKFECRCFVTRAMLYHIKAPWIWSVEWHDMMAMLEGGWKNGLTGTMPSGSEENWLKFFFNEVKPYDIDECFEGVREGRLDEMIIRNRTCVQGQGDMYQLFMYCQSSGDVSIEEEKPSTARISEMGEAGLTLIACEVCNAVNEIKDTANPGQCWRCKANLPKPTAKNIIKETVREIDWAAVGYSAKELAASKKAGKYKSSIELEEVGEGGDMGKSSMERLAELGRTTHSA
ncbi:TPA_asm: exonuclease [dsDNA virus vir530]|nr:TPA_asm: exonuclease [dsDNA virus vir530]